MPAQSVDSFQFTAGWTGDGCQQFAVGWLNRGGDDLFAVGWNRDNGCELFAVGWPYNRPVVVEVFTPEPTFPPSSGRTRAQIERQYREEDELAFAVILAFLHIKDDQTWH